MDKGMWFENIKTILSDLFQIHNDLVAALKAEKEILLEADPAKISAQNQQKEKLIIQVRKLDHELQLQAKVLAHSLGFRETEFRLKDLVPFASPEIAKDITQKHLELKALMAQIEELNKENVNYVNKALECLHGAVNNIKDTLSGSKTYQRKGQLERGPERSGNLVSKEA